MDIVDMVERKFKMIVPRVQITYRQAFGDEPVHFDVLIHAQ